MSLKDKILADLKTAMKTKDKDRLSVLRMIKAKILETEVSLRAERGRDYALNDEEVMDVLTKYAKQRRESIENYRNAGRDDNVAQEEAELAIVQEYLPKQLSTEEITQLVQAAIAESGAQSPRDMGKVMKIVVPQTKGVADGKLVSQIVKDLLNG
ncbi:MAG: GatB/YqeY domain-containing protein [Gemmatimonadetes bacterium]|nr:MAG: GatB/YqeY domain-containing protein [Gemmatimonadota bacterium]